MVVAEEHDLEELPIEELEHRGRLLRGLLSPRVLRHGTGHIKVARGEAIAGTGRPEVSTNDEVRKLIEDLRAAGADVRQPPSGGHWVVTYQGKRARISSTPRSSRSVLNDRARVRRRLGVKI